MNNSLQNDRLDIDKWTDQWQKAMEEGPFKEDPKPEVTSDNSVSQSYFGPVNVEQHGAINEVDSQYWKKMTAATKYYGQGYVDPLQIIDDEREDEVLDENTGSDKTKAADVAKGIAGSPNPVKAGSLGPDQDIHNPTSLGHTYTEKDLEEISDLKVQLHELENKLNTLEAKGSSGKKVETKISNMKKRLDDLSNDLNSSFPDKLES